MLKLLILLILLPGLLLAGREERRAFTAIEQDFLQQRLQEKGLEPKVLESLQLEQRSCHPQALEINLHHKDHSDFYKTFQKPQVLEDLREFLISHQDELTGMHERYGVTAEVVSAILMIESRLGKNRGKWPVLDLLLSLQLMRRDEVIQQNVGRALELDKEEGGKLDAAAALQKVQKRALRRSDWARKELLSFLRQFPDSTWSTHQGSWAAAMGNCQFLPSSRENYAVDGDGDGTINLDQMPDAIHSIGNYLKQNGWKVGQDRQKLRRVIRTYNHSDAYVDAVLLLADRLKLAGS